jgi:hypothetical protein
VFQELKKLAYFNVMLTQENEDVKEAFAELKKSITKLIRGTLHPSISTINGL